jgi:hypothetical protein
MGQKHLAALVAQKSGTIINRRMSTAAFDVRPPAWGDDFMYGTSAAHCSAEIRNGFLRKVYG